MLGPDGALSRFLPGFVYRPEQIAVAEAVSESLQLSQICMAEAGTGVGKTMAYLIPAVEQIRQNKRVVISTHTLNLQGQLMGKDIPLLQRAIGKPGFEAILVKGMGNYLCLSKLNSAAGQPTLLPDDSLQQVSEWASDTSTGDMAELPFRVPGWSEINCERDLCNRQECRFYSDCFYYNMRRSAEGAGLIVANHALFFSDLVIRMSDPSAGILPPYDFVIFDEAHHLEEVAGKVFGIEYSNHRIPTFLNRLRRIRGIPVDLGKLQALESLNEDFFRLFDTVRRQEFFLTDVFDGHALGELNNRGSQLCILLQNLSAELLGQAKETGEGEEDIKDRLEGYARTCARLQTDLQLLLFENDKGWFVWGAKPAQPGRHIKAVLHRSPMQVSDILAENFWNKVGGAALLSATLSNSGGFSYARARLGVPEAREVVVGSPFDFKNQSLLYVPAHLPFPSNAPEYVREMSEEIRRILTYSGGRAFLLFTSYRMMDLVHSTLASQLNYPLLRQGEMPNAALLEEFKRTPNACLFGTSSFWEGVDIQGEALSCVIIDKLPFSVPDSPTSRARIAAIEEAGGNAFAELSVPEAQIRLKQGFGRLIRTGADRGIVAIFDSRLIKKPYGQSFLKVLPPATLTRSLEDVRKFFEGAPAVHEQNHSV